MSIVHATAFSWNKMLIGGFILDTDNIRFFWFVALLKSVGGLSVNDYALYRH